MSCVVCRTFTQELQLRMINFAGTETIRIAGIEYRIRVKNIAANTCNGTTDNPSEFHGKFNIKLSSVNGDISLRKTK